jgi:mxaK protein
MTATGSRFRRWRSGLVLLGCAAALAGVLESAWRGYEARRIAAGIAVWRSGSGGAEEALKQREPVLMLARAVRYGIQGRHEGAAELFHYVAGQGSIVLQAEADYGLGNLHLRRALAFAERDEPARAQAEAELAKHAYQSALRLQPEDWDAKYNLELAHRLAPEFERVESGSEPPDERALRRLWATLPGRVRGLP